MAGVVAVLVSVLSIAEGIRATMANTGSPDSAIVMRSGSDSEMTSILMHEDIVVIKDAPEIARSSELGPLASAELFVGVDLVKASTGTTANAPLRGVEPAAFQVRNFKMVAGPAVRDRPERGDRRQRRRVRVRRPARRFPAQARPERLEHRRHLRRGRHGARFGALVRRRRARAALPPREQPAGGVRPADVARGVHGVQGPPDDRPAGEAEGHARAGVLRGPGRDALADDRRDRQRHRRC